MKRRRRISRVVTTAAPQPGFMGQGHTAVSVVDPAQFHRQDPFILLMDDRVDFQPGATAGEAHPHAGFETVTLVLEGEVKDRDEGMLGPGDVLWMTAGSGVIHNEDMVVTRGMVRILQLWLTLAKEDRWVAPSFQRIGRDVAPVRREPGVEARVHSGTSGGVRAPTRNIVPVTLVDVTLQPGATFDQDIPSSYNGFVYLVSGSAMLGESDERVKEGQVAWLDQPGGDESSSLRMTGGEHGARLLLYAGEPTGDPIVSHGPFIGDTREDIMRVSREYMTGRFPRMSQLTGDQLR